MKESEKLLYNLGQTSEYVKNYVQLQKEIIKLELVEGSSKLLSNIISRLVALMILLFTLLFASLTLAIGLSIALNSFLYGFGLVTIIFVLLAVLLVVKRESLMTAPILRLILKDLYKDDE
ncbi:phage holin family protein [Membranihabitans marinus]|uniref:phage holin family protein n=1 Tax=Membranihabitans marinus TaxID=1227546 RepID=UPI001F48AB67|nr:phage holin family protein [Membranihabitans marinus]